MSKKELSPLKLFAEGIIKQPPLHGFDSENLIEMAKRTLMTEKLKENSQFALMYVDNQFVLVDTKDNWLEVVSIL